MLIGPGDGRAIAVFLFMVALVAWNRFAFDSWLSRFDIYTQFLPWYDYLGDRTREFDVPGWNPHMLSGTPFAGHPLSGWMYLPAMIAFALFPVITAFKVLIVSHLVIAGLGVYALARVLGMGPLAGLVGAVVFAFGPFLEWNTYTSLQFAQFTVWVPLVLLGIELALRTPQWRGRLVPWCVAGIGISQMFAGWVGEGWIYAALITGVYAGYRAVFAPWQSSLGMRHRLIAGVATGTAALGSGMLLGAAGILPRFAVNAQTNLAGGAYADLEGGGSLNSPWDVGYLLTQIMGMGTGYHHRAAGLGGAIVVLMLLALLLARSSFAVPFFAGLTSVALILTLEANPVHYFFYLIPGYRNLHEHDPWRVVALASIGPAMLSAAAVEVLGQLRGRYRILPVVVALPLGVMAIDTVLGPVEGVAGWAPIIAAAAITELLVVIIAVPRDRDLRLPLRWIPQAALALVVAVIFIQPTGLELTGSWFGWPEDKRWERRWNPDAVTEQAREIEVRSEDPGGAGEYLQNQLDDSGPFRYLGYGGVGHPDGGWNARSYMDRRFDSYAQAILVNGRPMFLGLYEIQGYDPVQLARYVEYVAAINGKGQDYHTAFVSDEGVGSPLISLLHVRYILVDASLPQDRADVEALTSGYEEVFRTNFVVVHQRQDPVPHAWIVHDVRPVKRGDALPLIVEGEVDPYRTALVEGDTPDIEAVPAASGDQAIVTQYDAEKVTIETHSDAPGFLVVSEVYADGWRAFVNGRETEILPTHHALRGVPIPAGDATVEMRYEPLALRVGIPVSIGTAVVMLSVFALGGWRSRWASQVVTAERK
ncbi:MAG TPA: YfhO family protein [Thermomicrobiales bacterium]|nr:YfhO family protein [Thermomicrobiales bacterium]